MKKIILTFFCLSFVVTAMAQTSVTGNVVDNTGEAAIGATVLEEGTTNGTVTDIDGNFALTVSSANAKLQVSYTGFKTETIALNGRTFIKVVLNEDSQMLQDVVAIGYGSQKKKEVTGAVTSMKSKDFNSGIKSSPVGLLQGKVAGLNISRGSNGSDPTQTSFSIQIRGFSTLDKGTGSSPLFIVDGIPVNNIDNISPDDIAAMDVLKDGSAAAIYGTRGTNGVIIITTKRGADGISSGADCGKTTIEYSGYASFSAITGKSGMATPSEFRNLEEISGGKIKPTIHTFTATGRNDYETDWIKELTRPMALTHNHNLAISGAAKNFSYRGSVAFKNAQGIAKTSNRNELILKLAADQQALNGWLDIQYDFSYMHYRNDYFCGDFEQGAIVNPTYPVYDEKTVSGYFTPQGSGQVNPVELMNQKKSYQDGNYFRGSIRPSINIKAVTGLKLSAFFAMEQGNNYNYWSNKTINSDVLGSGKAGRNTDRNINKLFETTLDYVTNIKNHGISAILGFSYQNFMYDGSNMVNGGFPVESMEYYQMENGDITKTAMNIGSYRNSNTIAAVFGRVNYNYFGKYLLSVSLRREGSSRFGANNKWGWFPAASAGWRMSSEKFLKDVKWINDLKLRAGFGVTGNNLKDDLMSLSVFSKSGEFLLDGEWVSTYSVGRNENRDLRWEKKYEYNIGLDFAFCNNRIFGTIDAYLRNTKDLLWDYKVPSPPYQYETLLANAGQMRSMGLEIAVNFVPVKTKDFAWTTTPTIAFNKGKITKLSDPSKGFNYDITPSGGVGRNGIQNTNTQILIEGEPVGIFYGYKFAGFKSDGTWMFETPAGGYVDEPTEDQRQVIGNSQPLFTFGWNNTFTYKNFDLSFFFRGVYGNDVLNVTRWAYGPESSQSMNVFMKDAREGVYTNKKYFSDYYLEKGSYVKLDNITLGYNFKIKENKYVRALRLYATGQNLFTITKYSGVDPEVNTADVWNGGIDQPNFYPLTSNFLIGVTVTFN